MQTHVSWKRLLVVFVATLGGVAAAQEGQRAPERSGALEGETRRVVDVDLDLDDALGEVVVTAPRRGIELVHGVRAYGTLTTGYVRNLGDVPTRKDANAGRLSDPDHDTFGLTQAQVGLARDVSGGNALDLGFRVEVGVGRLYERALRDDGLFDDDPIDLPQAYVQAQLPTPLGKAVVVTAGRMEGWFGHERLDLSQNVNFSLGNLTAFTPRTFTGAAMTLELVDDLSYTQYLGNGWDVVQDGNDAKTVGGALTYRLGDLSLRGSWILGAEGADVGAKRWAVGLDARYVSPLFGTELRAALLYGQEEGDGARDLAKFGGLSVAVKQGFLRAGTYDRVSLAVRGEWFRDQGGSRSGVDQTLWGVTATLEVKPLEALSLRVEYRHDGSSRDVFHGASSSSASGGSDEQDTLSASLTLAF